jgi:hypothetical protein
MNRGQRNPIEGLFGFVPSQALWALHVPPQADAASPAVQPGTEN